MSRHRSSRRQCWLGAACALLAVAVGPAAAQPRARDPGPATGQLSVDPDPPLQVVQEARISLEQAVALARRRYEGRVVRAETRSINGRPVHVIRILDSNGRVRTVRIDAQTGRMR